MEHYELIRRKVVIEGKSQRDVAKELGHSRKTIAKALKLRIPPGYRLSKQRPSPVIEPVRHIIDAWLEQNKQTRPKQRQTDRRILSGVPAFRRRRVHFTMSVIMHREVEGLFR